jgi:mannose-1-phosphate guanylyltransferase
MYAVILAGGGGTRLWPLSRPETPKPFLPLTGERSLLQRTADRLVGHPELPLTAGDLAVVTDRRYGALVRAQLPGATVLEEPVGRNTAAAVALATVRLERDPDEVMIVLPADQTIRDEAGFRAVIAGAGRLAAGAFGIEAPLVTLGIRPTHAATVYGYLLPDLEGGGRVDGLEAYPLLGFREKPDPARAAELVARPGTAWNAGIFLWRRRAIRDAVERATGLIGALGPVAADPAALTAVYERLPSVSIDHGVMEGAAAERRVVTAAMEVGWSDLGSWTALLEAVGATGEGRVVQAGEPAEAGPDDLIVERVDGRLVAVGGPRGILATTPTALLAGAAATDRSRDAVLALVDRVAAWEALA